MMFERMRRARIVQRLADLGVWSVVVGAILFVASWWPDHGTAVIDRLAAWSSPALAPSQPPVVVTMGPWKRRYFDQVRKTAIARRADQPSGSARSSPEPPISR
jgi:hypothetical protein